MFYEWPISGIEYDQDVGGASINFRIEANDPRVAGVLTRSKIEDSQWKFLKMDTTNLKV